MSAIQDRLKKLSPKSVTGLLLLVPVLLAAAFVYFVYLPDSTKIADLRVAIEKNESEISKSQVMQRKLAELKAANQRLQEELKVATEKLPSGEEESRLPEVVADLIKSSGLTMKSWTPGQKKPGPGGLYSETPIKVEVNGGYHEFGRLMEGLDKMARMIVITDLNMSSAKVEGRKMNIPVKFTMEAFSAAGGK
jgi:type IV pilus assembly protein PilO